MTDTEPDYRSPMEGGCWICKTETGGSMVLDTGFDTFVHTACLDDAGVESVLEYEKQREQ